MKLYLALGRVRVVVNMGLVVVIEARVLFVRQVRMFRLRVVVLVQMHGRSVLYLRIVSVHDAMCDVGVLVTVNYGAVVVLIERFVFFECGPLTRGHPTLAPLLA
jgi:hypothetical protein